MYWCFKFWSLQVRCKSRLRCKFEQARLAASNLRWSSTAHWCWRCLHAPRRPRLFLGARWFFDVSCKRQRLIGPVKKFASLNLSWCSVYACVGKTYASHGGPFTSAFVLARRQHIQVSQRISGNVIAATVTMLTPQMLDARSCTNDAAFVHVWDVLRSYQLKFSDSVPTLVYANAANLWTVEGCVMSCWLFGSWACTDTWPHVVSSEHCVQELWEQSKDLAQYGSLGWFWNAQTADGPE